MAHFPGSGERNARSQPSQFWSGAGRGGGGGVRVRAGRGGGRSSVRRWDRRAAGLRRGSRGRLTVRVRRIASGVMPRSIHVVTAGARRCTSRAASRRRGSWRRRPARSDTAGSEGAEGVECSGAAAGGVEEVIGRFGRWGVAGVWSFGGGFGPELPVIAGGLLYDVVRVTTRPDGSVRGFGSGSRVLPVRVTPLRCGPRPPGSGLPGF